MAARPATGVAVLQDVRHSYGPRTALAGVSCSVAPGVTGVIGVNGAGKSTLLRVLAAELRPDHGTVEVLDRRRVGVMPQSAELPGEVTVTGFLTYMAWLRGIRRRDRRDAVDAALELADLADRRRERIGALSGGMHRRLLLAQAVLAEPALLVLDEPTAGLDPEQRVRLRERIGTVPWECAVVVSSHLMEDLTPVADRVLMLDAGVVAFDGTVEELRAVGAAARGRGEAGNVDEAAFLALRGTHP